VRRGLNALAYTIILTVVVSSLVGCGLALYQIYTDPALYLARDLITCLAVMGGGYGAFAWAGYRLSKQWGQM
jgi:hypothetical protein